MTEFRWIEADLAAIRAHCAPTAPLIRRAALGRVAPELDLWDHWPVLNLDGSLARFAGGLLVVALVAPMLPDPDARHAVARLRLYHHGPWGWRDLGHLLPDGFSPGSREWAGSAIVNAERTRLMLYFTAAGIRGEARLGYEQRLFETNARLTIDGERIALADWTPARELVRPDGLIYQADTTGGGAVGTIKAFRDPYFCRVPGDRSDYLIFAGSRAAAATDWNGVIGAARRGPGGWALLPPLVDASGVNNELERPHLLVVSGRHYLFWSTQAKVFAPGIIAPTGLYGVVADRLNGPWRPLNGHGLVFANPPQAPRQAYSWQVLPDLSVWSFADLVELPCSPPDPATARAHFAGTPAPSLRLTIAEDRAELVL